MILLLHSCFSGLNFITLARLFSPSNLLLFLFALLHISFILPLLQRCSFRYSVWSVASTALMSLVFSMFFLFCFCVCVPLFSCLFLCCFFYFVILFQFFVFLFLPLFSFSCCFSFCVFIFLFSYFFAVHFFSLESCRYFCLRLSSLPVCLSFYLSLFVSFSDCLSLHLSPPHIHSLPPALIHLLYPSFTHSLICLLSPSLTLSRIRFFLHLFAYSLPHSFTHTSFFFIFTAPAGPPQDVSVHLVNLTHASVTWRPPEADLQHGVITGYQVSDHVF